MIDSRLGDARATVRRRRECLRCSHRFTTFERFEREQPRVVKGDGRREPWDEEKLRRGLLRALEKRPVGLDQVEALINDISREIQLRGEPEIRSAVIGEVVMSLLPSIDEIAYVRYASVYRSFEDVRAFLEEIERLEHELPPELKRNQLDLLESDGDEN